LGWPYGPTQSRPTDLIKPCPLWIGLEGDEQRASVKRKLTNCKNQPFVRLINMQLATMNAVLTLMIYIGTGSVKTTVRKQS